MKPIKLYTDLSVHLYEGEAVKKRGTPITYLTQWQLVGNSQVHTDPYLTQWKVSGNSQIQQYLTQWKVEGNSVVDNNAILSCGDLGQDGYYHVKISNGSNVYDIALTEPLRKVNDVADSIEFANGSAVLTRNLAKAILSDLSWQVALFSSTGKYRYNVYSLQGIIKLSKNNNTAGDILCSIYNTVTANGAYATTQIGIAVDSVYGSIYLYDADYNQEDDIDAFKAHIQGAEMVYALANPTTETIQAPQISVSSTYTSANDVAYSSFTYANPLIYSCGDYSDVDNKYHVKISNGVTIYDIPLTEPLRKVNDVADTIEFANGTAVVTRNIASAKWNDLTVRYEISETSQYACFYTTSLQDVLFIPNSATERIISCLSADFIQDIDPITRIGAVDKCMCTYKVNDTTAYIYLRDTSTTSVEDFYEKYGTHEFYYRLATPTTEVIQVSPFPISATDTYTSANDTPYSAFEHTENKEIWSCGEYNAVDGKYHILVQPQGGSIADIALDEPLRKVNDVADSIELVNGIVTLTRAYKKLDWDTVDILKNTTNNYFSVSGLALKYSTMNMLSNLYPVYSRTTPVANFGDLGIGFGGAESSPILRIVNTSMNDLTATEFAVANAAAGIEIIYELATPTTETIQVPQIEEADSYSCEISQGGKAVSWSSFETE